ncbi:MAG: phosphoprotein [Carlia munda bornavirus]|uniref:Phosphoprotein n=1 Tax=Carlia munda bornavirus TaxID=3141953 RepID=A0AAU7SRU7_9MONO
MSQPQQERGRPPTRSQQNLGRESLRAPVESVLKTLRLGNKRALLSEDLVTGKEGLSIDELLSEICGARSGEFEALGEKVDSLSSSLSQMAESLEKFVDQNNHCTNFISELKTKQDQLFVGLSELNTKMGIILSNQASIGENIESLSAVVSSLAQKVDLNHARSSIGVPDSSMGPSAPLLNKIYPDIPSYSQNQSTSGIGDLIFD